MPTPYAISLYFATRLSWLGIDLLERDPHKILKNNILFENVAVTREFAKKMNVLT